MMISPHLSLFAADVADKCAKGNGFFGLKPWYEYLPDDRFAKNSCDIVKFTILPGEGQRSDIPLVLLAIVDDLLRLAGLVAVAFVIYGGISLITSQGNPEDTGKAQSTLINALIGLVVAVVAVAFVSFVGNAVAK